jgi:hypothetical protein
MHRTMNSQPTVNSQGGAPAVTSVVLFVLVSALIVFVLVP